MPEQKPPPIDDRDEDAPGDDTELTAYLDGELEEHSAREVEARLARDPEARRRADDLKKSYDLLDYLPKREPSADFATRTITKLLPALSDAGRPQVGSPSTTVQATASSRPSGSTMVLEPIEPTRPFRFAIFWLILSAVCGGGAYAAHAFARPYLAGPVKDRGDLATDYRMLVHLPWYLGVDDLGFLKQLDEPDLFVPKLTTTAAVPAPEPNGAATDRHIELFQSYPPARKQQLRKLDQELHELPTPDQNRLCRVLEDYALWLDRLSDADRREVLIQPDAAERLEAVRRLRQKQWRESLPEPVRKKIAGAADIEERLEFVRQFKKTQQGRRDEWTLAHRQWDTLHGPDRKEPWPFSDPQTAKQLEEYIRTVFKVDFEVKLDPKSDLPSGTRLSKQEFFELRETKRAATNDGKWFLYGLTIHRLAEKHPYLPEPRQRPFVNAEMIPPESLKDLPYKAWFGQLNRKTLNRGKWPEFALEVAEAPKRFAGVAPPPSFFGPCKPGDFTEPIDRFLAEQLLPKLSPAEKDGLGKLEGKWPEYPRQMIALSSKPNVDLAVPGVTLPGKPSLWMLYYDFVAAPAANPPAVK